MHSQIQRDVFLAGYYGFGNTGDELILAAILRSIEHEIPGARVTVMSGDPVATAASFGVDAIDWRDPHAMLRAVENASLVIIGGGGLFHDYFGAAPDVLLTPASSGLGLFAGVALASALRRKPLLLWNVGAGPLNSPHGRDLVRYVARTAAAVTVRDAGSLRVLESLGIDSSKITVASDPIFTLDLPRSGSGQVRQIVSGNRVNGEPLIAVCLRNWEVGVDSSFWMRQVAQGLDALATAVPARFLFVPFQVADVARENDAAAGEQVAALMSHRDRAVVLPRALAPDDTRELIGECDAVLGMRLHSVLIAACAGVPPVALSYDAKVEHLVDDLGLKAYHIPLGSVTGSAVSALLEEALRRRDELKPALLGACRILGARAAGTARIAAKLVHGELAFEMPVQPESERLALVAIEAQTKSAAAADARARDLERRSEELAVALAAAESAKAEIVRQLAAATEALEQSEAALATLAREKQNATEEAAKAAVRAASAESLCAQLSQQCAASEAALRSAHAAMRMVETAGKISPADHADFQQLRSALAELKGWADRQAHHIQELAGWTGRQAEHIEVLERQVSQLSHKEAHARENYELLAHRLSIGRTRRVVQAALDAVQSMTPESWRRAVRPYYLPLYHRLIAPARASASLRKAAVLPIDRLSPPVRDLSGMPEFEIAEPSLSPSYLPKISVVLPVWNHGKLLPGAIRSVLNQTWRNLELIIVDDGSGQDLAPAIREAVANDPRVRVVRRPHEGLPQALSAGFRFAAGELLTWTSADNLMKPEMLATLASFLLRRPDVDMTYADMDLIDGNGNPLFDSGYRVPAQRQGATNELRLPRTVQALSLLNDNFIGAAFLYRAEIGRVLGDYDAALLGTEDYDYWLRLGASGRIEHVDCDRCLCSYRVHDDSLSGRHAPEIGHNAVRLIEQNRNRTRWYRRPLQVAVITGMTDDRALPALAEALATAGHAVTVIDGDLQGAEWAAGRWLSAGRKNGPEPKLAFISGCPAPPWLASFLRGSDDGIAVFFSISGEEPIDAWAVGDHPVWALCASSRVVAQLPPAMTRSWSLLPPSAFEFDELMISLRARDGAVQPWDMPDIPGPLFVYIGPIDDGIMDWEAVNSLARANPSATIVFIAHAGRDAVDPRSRLSGPARIVFLGAKRPEEWRAYLSCAALLLAPLLDLPDACETLHDMMLTYVAAGKPILATEAIGAAGFSDAPNTWIVPAAKFQASDALHSKPDLRAADLYLARKSPAGVAARVVSVLNERLFRPMSAAPLTAAEPPRILLETVTFDHGGLERVVLEQARDLHRRGHAVSVAVTGSNGKLGDECRALGIPVHEPGPDPAAFDRLLEFEAPELLIPHYSNIGSPLAWRRGIPVLSFIHNSYIWTTEEQNRAIRDTDLYTTQYIAVSRTAARFFARKYFVNPEKIACIPNGTGIRNLRDSGKPAIGRADLGLDAKDFVLLNVASVFGTKAQIHAVAALKALRNEIPRLRLLCVGAEADAAYAAAVREFIRDAGLGDRVRLCGKTEAVADYYRLSDVFLMTSLAEGWSLAKTEAMMFGLPLILTDVGGAAEVIRDGDIGILVPPAFDDPIQINANNLWEYCTNRAPSNLDALVAAIREAYRDREAWRAKGQLAAAKVMREFSTEVIGERQYREIEIVLARHGQGRSLALPAMQRTS